MFLAESTNILDLVQNPSAWDTLLEDFVRGAGSFVGKLVGALIIWFIGKKLVKLAQKVFEKILRKSELDESVIVFLCSLVKFVLYCLVIIIIIGTLGVETASLITVFGSAGLAIGLALQGSLSNFAGGILILITKPFQIGDYISATGLEGSVAKIDLLYTKLNTVDNKIIMIPNGTLANSSIVNVGKEDVRRVDITVGISYESDIKTAKQVFADVIKKNSLVLKDKEIKIIVAALGASSVDIQTRVWVKSENYWDAMFELTEAYKYALDENGISIPYNQLDVHIQNK